MKIGAMGDSSMSIARRFINPTYLEPDARADLHEWYMQGKGGPRTLRNFLSAEFATALGDALRSLPYWVRYASVYEGDVRTREVDEKSWEGHPDKAARHYLIRPMLSAIESPDVPEEHRKVLKQFLAFVVTGPYFLSWVSCVVGDSLEPRTSFEFTRYGTYDHITPHHDLIPGRVLAANFYLDDQYEDSRGGRLWFRDADGEDYATLPEFNSFTMIPIRDGCRHWVEPYTGSEPGRYTANLQIHREY
ncbi:2OG-Fe(II) oxygenase [Streptomyces sp. AM2-3-1]|uniref:2OG-Fe(II) oxygenase n=1 Tax=Streptomyces sp. AM2-3-1 TaxID=3075824 RepID=UPI0028C46C43|nr:2OG-Fe(II) oxygenase [Streptomyces sp. AM2-3-1]WNO67452.1 2OG-Fe(II) oxygenase [Streptomyces sp. AM2-3-1]